MQVTTDDLIPFLVYIIILAKPRHLATELFLMSYFTFTNISTSQLGFYLVSLQAAVEYLKSEEFRKTVQEHYPNIDSGLISDRLTGATMIAP